MNDARVQNLNGPEDPLTLVYTLTANRFAPAAGNPMLVRARVLGVKGEDVLEGEKRKYPLEFEYASTQGAITKSNCPRDTRWMKCRRRRTHRFPASPITANRNWTAIC